MKLESELEEVRKKHNAEWEETKFHIQQAKNGVVSNLRSPPKPKLNGYILTETIDSTIHM